MKRLGAVNCITLTPLNYTGFFTLTFVLFMKLAFVHDYLYTYGGAERLLEAMHRVFPDAPIFTAQYVHENLPQTFPHQYVRPISLAQSRFWRLFAKQLTFLYPVLFETLDLSGYDVVISSSASFAKGVITTSQQKHICYCHTPPRFLYNYEGESTKRDRWYYRPFVGVVDYALRQWDYAASYRVDHFIANSKNTARRIKKFYNRDASVVYPPVLLPKISNEMRKQKHFLIVSRLAAYKHVELAVLACTALNEPLVIVGEGPERSRLEAMAGETIQFVGFVPDEQLQTLYQEAHALIYTTRDEDFGITPIEAMAYGVPVIAHNSGGMRESVIDGETGVLFDDYSVKGLQSAIQQFQQMQFDETTCRNRAEQFSFERFQEQFEAIIRG